jgi:hypothetical protein
MTRPRTLADWFPKNLGTMDRLRRITVGLCFLSLVFIGPETYVALLALFPLLTGLIGRCPVTRWLETDSLDEEPSTMQRFADEYYARAASPRPAAMFVVSNDKPAAVALGETRASAAQAAA